MRVFSNHLNGQLLFSWILVVLHLSLILKSGLYSDDIPEFQFFNSAGMSLPALLHFIYERIVSGIMSGRFTPLAYLQEDVLFWISKTLLVYKLIILTINLLAVYLFTRLLKIFELADWLPSALLVYCATCQFYINYHDAFTSLHAMYPFLALLVFSSFILFTEFLKNGKPLILAGAVLMVAFTIFFSEAGFVVYPVLIVLLMFDRRRFSKKVLVFMPFVFLLIAYIVTFVAIRQHVKTVYSGVSANFDVSKMYDTFLFQVRAAIPMSHFTGMYAIPAFLGEQFSRLFPLTLACCMAFTGFLMYDRKHVYISMDSRKRYTLLFIGLTLLILPACFLMVSVKYQDELGYGKGYLPVYIQDFGFVLLMLVLFSFIFSRSGRIIVIIKNGIFILFFVISLCTLMLNNSLMDYWNEVRSTPSLFYYLSLKHGILNDCEDGSVIVLRTDFFWHSAGDYQLIIDNFYKKGFLVIEEDNFKGISPEDKKHFYMLEHNKDGQFTLLYKLMPGETEVVKRINYPTGKDFSYFDLISRPL